MRCVLRTPEAEHFNGDIRLAVLPATDGEIGILARHAAMVCALGTGACRLTTDKGVITFAMSGGFSRVHGDVVTVLTTRCEAGAEISEEEVRRSLEEARAADPGEEKTERLLWARARLAAAKRSEAAA
jgi:F-type H+-transporting ATPase subunit epsilon